ncbi:NAD(P)-dependent oxidoreductase [Roseomonas sp. KE2513]|uniref:NAD-dependent epimerase/dehydratase family protein n=1 Tax=Roseomonas sp. KE2513 TaxID=2479202 RepID=UPI0018DF447B|nr:NAD(P)-dependent oxidoreductase [Roseomonas sp. KE2513]MBI0539383.1 NAD(P)-dependent oxidoreductase [Roseomonas sp. KE2513]
MTKVALSGASGQIGRFLRPALLERGIDLRSAGGRTPLEPLRPGEDVMHGDLRDPGVVDRLLQGVEVLIHMAGTSVERPLSEVIENNLVGLRAVYEGARRHKVRRIVFASSNHAIGMHEVTEKLGPDCDFRPDGFYGLSKMWGEGLARLYWDKHGIESVCVRIGSALPCPTEPRHLSTWFGLDDLLQFTLRCIEAPSAGFVVAWGVSANTRSWWTPTSCEVLGYHPTQNAEDYAAEVLAKPNPLDTLGQRYQGGGFVGLDYTPPERRPSPAR